ncbi:MAG TPA: phage portal protein, partial [Aggregatilineales bacterium]|nr:phage portal protein [Aggregatilineales bacterium]
MLTRLSGRLYDTLGIVRSAVGRLAFKGDSSRGTWGDVLSLIGEHAKNDWPDLSQFTNQAGMFISSPWVYVAISKIARTAALVDLHVLRTFDGQRQRVPDHPIAALLRKPNAYQSQFELLEATVGFLQINGNAFWFLNGPAGGLPTEILVLRPDRVRIVAGGHSGQIVTGYVYDVDGIDIPLAPEEVIHFRRWHPANDLYGLSPIEAAAVDVQSDLAMSRWNKQYFSVEKAIPAGVVSIKSPLSDSEYERIQREWRESYGGTQRKTAFIRGAEITFQEIGISHKEMDFQAGRQFNKELIMLIFGIPPGMLDANATEANARAAIETFTRDTIWPCMVEIAEKLTAQLAPFWGDDVTIEAEDIRVRDTTADREELAAFAPYLSINEARERYMHLPAVSWGDRPASGAGAVAVTGQNVARPGHSVETGQIFLTPADYEAR